MNILFLTLLDFNDIDEHGIYTDLLREFSKRGNILFIVSPTERKKKEATYLLEINDNIKILKLQIGNIQKTNFIEKGIATIALETKFIKGIKKYFDKAKMDLILYSTPPITLQKAVEFVKKRDGAKTYLLLKDIFPQNAVDLGMLSTTGIKKYLYKYFRNKETNLYKISDYIGCMSKANVDFILQHNPCIKQEMVEICPNSIEPTRISIEEPTRNEFRKNYNIPLDKTIFIYGGNLGKPQGIEFLIECIKINENNANSFIVVVGSGTEAYKLKNYFMEAKPKNAKLINQLPKDEYEALANSCDVGLIFLDKRFKIPNFPSRLLSYMQASMPVLAATDINTDIGEVIQNGNFGYWCESINEHKFNNLIKKLCDKELRVELGNNARKYLEENYTSRHSYEIIMKHFI